ncbi:MAG: hypothetical protein PWQ82_1310 [Thermosediminibacterales bacterium]|nr:hypothetical protein [Thermosediminibacterales bacterium]MDK2836364.1 hypothetical protein [Thermosediminibacterales bacterium]
MRNIEQKIETLLSVLKVKDSFTYVHTQRVAELSTMLAEKIGLSENQIITIKHGAMLHDIGKIEINRSILNKSERLTKEEWNILKQHPVWGAEIAKSINLVKAGLPAIMFHHERWDGKGYPNGLKGEEIPLEARIICIADSFDAMTSHRPYRNALTIEQAIHELNRCRGTQFDPYLLDYFIPIIKNQK